MSRTRQNVDRRAIALLSLCHGCTDLANGAVPALLPFFIIDRGYSYAETTALIFAVTVASSVLQPLFGYLADRRARSWLMPVGMAIAGLSVAMVGPAEQYWLTFVLICVAGIGIAAFHPEAARYANYVSGSLRARGMSLFSVGGNTGFAFGPILVTPLVLTFGLNGTLWLLLPFGVITTLLVFALPYVNSFAPSGSATAESTGRVVGEDRDRWGPFWLLTAISALRSTTHFGLQAFIPAFFIVSFSATTAAANGALTALLICGALGTLIGGRIADRVGIKKVILVCLSTLPALILAILFSSQAVAYVLVSLVGFFTIATFAPMVVIGQQLLPNRIGIASGMTLGASIGVGGALAAALGPVADGLGLDAVIVILALIPVPAVLLTLLLPGPQPRWRKVQPAEGA